MGIISAFFFAIITLAILMVSHELGHLLVARRCGIKVERFQIGFGKPLCSWTDAVGTQYVIAPILLGAYVKMLDERDGDVNDSEIHMAHNRKSVWQRIAVAAGGPAANFLLAIAIFWVLFFSGETGYAPIIGKVESDSPADIAGIEAGFEIISIDGTNTPTRRAVGFRLLDYLGDTGVITMVLKDKDSDLRMSRSIIINQWLAGVENPDLFGGLGIEMYEPPIMPVVGKVVAESAAERAGFLAGDLIVTADEIEIREWSDWVNYVRVRPSVTIRTGYLRNQELRFADLVPLATKDSEGRVFGRVGMWVSNPEIPKEHQRKFDRGVWSSLNASINRTYELAVFTLKSIKKMLMGLISPKNLSGPITIAKAATASAFSGLEAYLGFVALLSVSLGVLNLLPIPVLDGGHLLYYSFEVLLGRPIPERMQVLGYQMGIVLVFGIMTLAIYNDLVRL